MRPNEKRVEQWSPDVARVAEEIESRLRDRGIEVRDTDTPDDLQRIAEAVEEFESAVQEAGGDLMVDEPPTRENAQPDDPRFLLPVRRDDETVKRYLDRLQSATRAIRG